MQTMEYATAKGLLRVERTMQEVTWEDGPVESWKQTDIRGHDHRYHDRKQEMPIRDRPKRARRRAAKGKPVRLEWTHYPSLLWVIDRREHCGGWGSDHDPHVIEHGHYECRACGQQIEPAHGPGSKLFPVSESYTLTETAENPPAGWFTDHPGESVSMTYQGGRNIATRVRYLPKAEAKQLIAAEWEAARGEEVLKAARKVAGQLGYPAEFIDPPP